MTLSKNARTLMLKCIKQRSLLTEPRIGLRNLLKANGTESYIKGCVNRILDEKLVDGIMIDINMNDIHDLLLTKEGISISSHILEGYCDIEKLNSCISFLYDTKKLYKDLNDQVMMLKAMNIGTLIAMTRGVGGKDLESDTAAEIKLLARAEINARLPHSIIQRWIDRIAKKIYMAWRFKGLYIYAFIHPGTLKVNRGE